MCCSVMFLESGRPAPAKGDPQFPDGRDVDLRCPSLEIGCCYNVPYPAPRPGSYILECSRCTATATVVVAGRVDDPRTVVMPCDMMGRA